MGLYQKISDDAKTALKEGNSFSLSVLRMVISAVKMLEIEKSLKEIDDQSVLQVIQRQAKQHKESIEQFGKGNRHDLAEKELKELRILESYMPKQLTEDELTAMVKEAISETGAKSKADIGKIMKIVMEKSRGRSDGKTINQIVARFIQ